MMKTIKSLIAVALLGSLTACGFQPLYGNLTNGAAVTEELEGIAVGQSNSRLGVILRNYLIDQLQPSGRGGDVNYRLAFRIREGQIGAGERLDASVTRYTYRLTVAYNLTNAKTGKVDYTGQSFSAVSYDVVDSQFATVVSREDAQDRAAREISEDMKIRLAMHFNNQEKQ